MCSMLIVDINMNVDLIRNPILRVFIDVYLFHLIRRYSPIRIVKITFVDKKNNFFFIFHIKAALQEERR